MKCLKGQAPSKNNVGFVVFLHHKKVAIKDGSARITFPIIQCLQRVFFLFFFFLFFFFNNAFFYNRIENISAGHHLDLGPYHFKQVRNGSIKHVAGRVMLG